MIDLDAIKARLAAATPGPWRVSRQNIDERPGTSEVCDLVNDCWVIVEHNDLGRYEDDADLIAHAPADIAGLVAEVERLRGEIERLRADVAEGGERETALRSGCVTIEGVRHPCSDDLEQAMVSICGHLGDERDTARRMLAECYVLSGADTNGNTPESGWVHLWRAAVEEVRQLRADYDDHSDIERVERERDEARAEVGLLQQEARIRRHISDGLASEVAAERAAVVAWLREVADAPETYIDEGIALRDASAAIERGAHRREEAT